VIDREGEFSTLRGIHPYLLVGRDGDVAADTHTAKLLARKILELNLSAVVDLSEMTPGQQREYVRVFIDALNHAPRALWKDCLIVIDEAHIFAPESGKGSSEATETIALLLSTGRKRGFCPVLATQRLAKLNKDVAAECLNKLIGRTSNEDVKRAGEELAQGKQSSIQLRGLDPGQFWAYGPAIAPEPDTCAHGQG
jgi:DNA helicase HerA-like ATPase